MNDHNIHKQKLEISERVLMSQFGHTGIIGQDVISFQNVIWLICPPTVNTKFEKCWVSTPFL